MTSARDDLGAPHATLLSNGRYRVLLTDAGAGMSAWEDIALTRWAEDGTRDADGLACLVQDLDRQLIWSAGRHPVGGDPVAYHARRGPGRAQIVREDHGIETRLDCTVFPDLDGEIRLLTLVNQGSEPRRLAVTSYVDVALNYPAADTAHPAFSKLFVQTEYVTPADVLLARRRPRSPDEPPSYLGHALWVEGQARRRDSEFETDRARFIGRGRSLAGAIALEQGHILSRAEGSVLDPVLSFRRVVHIRPGASVCLVALLVSGRDRQRIVEGLAPPSARQLRQAFRAGAAREQALLDTYRVPEDWQRQLHSLTGALAYGAPRPELNAPLPPASAYTQGDLRQLGLTGGLPLVLMRVRSPDDLAAARALSSVASYWRAQGVGVDLLVLDDCGRDNSLGGTDGAAARLGRTVVPGSGRVSPELLALAERVARIVVTGTLPASRDTDSLVRPRVQYSPMQSPLADDLPTGEPLQAWNGWGGFSADGQEYVIRLSHGPKGLKWPPLPWANCVANEQVGFLATESGAGYTWSANSRENKLTVWSNDPVSDPHSEALYLRDEDAHCYWSPLPGPVPGAGAYEVRHSFGATRYRHAGMELDQDTVMFVPRQDPVKLVRLRVTNTSKRTRRFSLFSFTEWVLGAHRGDARRCVVSAREATTGAILAVNPHRGEFAARTAFAAMFSFPPGPVEATADRSAFLGLRGSVASPAAVTEGGALVERIGAGLDPCAAFRVPFTLAPGETAEHVILLGEAESRDAATTLLRRYGELSATTAALEEVRHYWTDLVCRMVVRTPSPPIDLMLNGWLVYQTLSCRIWARSAFYQSGGAYGFRDQLQDAAALIHVDPSIARRQILLHAAHQFQEGDVLHWWHPPRSKGIRTRFADDLLWLPYVTAGYIRHSGDGAILDEPVEFLTGPALEPGEGERFLVPSPSGEWANVYEHCCRAMDRSLTRGAHGLPLIGTGDWNDGMNRVGREGRGESVWLGFFLHHIVEAFLPLCNRRGDSARVERYSLYLAELRQALNDAGWDGAWYRRAFYDNGLPLGSADSDECRIDAIAQAWAVLSRAAPTARANQALDAMEAHLVDEAAGLIRLLYPPFDQTPWDPGYIKGYLPGVRENGGQYTHGALWAVRALAEANRPERAAALLTMLSPVHQGGTAEQIARYQLEPYVIAADVYGVAPHVGRGGWSWYTGSAGWMLRVGLESVLGVTLTDGDTLELRPCIPRAWPGFSLRYTLPDSGTVYDIVVTQATPQRAGETDAEADGERLEVLDGAVHIPLRHDGATHQVRVTLGQDVGPRYVPSALPLVRATSA